MIARGFKPVGWAAAIGGAALGCYMLSLNVASERAELEQIERQIIAAKQDIRTLQTELGTRGRLAQLEQWNADVLALSAPGSNQFLSNEFKLASLMQPERGVDQVGAEVRLASADIIADQPSVKSAVGTSFEPAAEAPAKPLLRRASIVTLEAPHLQQKKPTLVRAAALKGALAKPEHARSEPEKPASKKASMLGADLLAEISDAARAEKKAGGAGGR